MMLRKFVSRLYWLCNFFYLVNNYFIFDEVISKNDDLHLFLIGFVNHNYKYKRLSLILFSVYSIPIVY